MSGWVGGGVLVHSPLRSSSHFAFALEREGGGRE